MEDGTSLPQAPKRQAIGSLEAGDVNSGDPDYAPIPLSESEADDEMREPIGWPTTVFWFSH